MIALTRRRAPAPGPVRTVPRRVASSCWPRRLVHWNLLDAAEQARLEELIRLFLVDKKWEGTAGFVLGDDVRVLITAMACLLILGLDYEAYHRVTWIEVQPTTMRRVGESSPWASAAWRATARCRCSVRPATPVRSRSPGTRPRRRPASRAGPQRRVPRVRAQARHGGRPGRRHPGAGRSRRASAVDRGVHRRLRSGARGSRRASCSTRTPASIPGEFFAVATETFFDRPDQLEQAHPDLYDVLRSFYRQDPAARARRAGPR